MTIIREMNPSSLSPRLKAVLDDGTELFSFNLELFQDIKYGDFIGMFGPPDPSRTDVETWSIIEEMMVNDNLDKAEEIREAFNLIMDNHLS